MGGHIVLDGYEVSGDPTRFDIAVVHGYLTESYWSPGIPRDVVERAIGNSVCVGAFCGSEQVGFARVVTDKATFGYLADVFVLEAHRGKGLSKAMMEYLLAHEDLRGLRRFLLATRDAHGLYRQFGFTALANPVSLMEILRPDVYRTVLRPRAD